jgi:hypothetical protein
MARHTALINRLWPGEADRKIAEPFCSKFDVPGMAERIPVMLQEAAATADRIAAGEISVDDGRSYLGSFAAEGLGVAPHLMQDLGAWFDNPGIDAAATETPPPQPAPPAPAPAAAPARPATVAPVPDRAALQAEVAKWNSAMRAPEGSPEWREYWRGPGQAAYLDTLRALEAADASPPPPLAGGADAPAPAAAEPAQPGTGHQ